MSSSLSAGAVYGDRHGHLHHRTPALYFISKGKGILQSRIPISLLFRVKGESGDCRAALCAVRHPNQWLK